MLDCNIIDFKLLPGGPLNFPALSCLNLSLLTSLTKLLSCPGAYKLNNNSINKKKIISYLFCLVLTVVDFAIDIVRPVANEQNRIEVSSGSARHPDGQSVGGARIKFGTRSRIGRKYIYTRTINSCKY
jgi:hypothetical protein